MVLIVSLYWDVKFIYMGFLILDGFDRLCVLGRQIYLYGISYKMVLIVSPYWEVRFIYHNSSQLAKNSFWLRR